MSIRTDLMNYQGMDSVYDWEMTRLCKEMKELDIPLEIMIVEDEPQGSPPHVRGKGMGRRKQEQ